MVLQMMFAYVLRALRLRAAPRKYSEDVRILVWQTTGDLIVLCLVGSLLRKRKPYMFSLMHTYSTTVSKKLRTYSTVRSTQTAKSRRRSPNAQHSVLAEITMPSKGRRDGIGIAKFFHVQRTFMRVLVKMRLTHQPLCVAGVW